MGVVYLAFDREIKREVALKTIRDIQSTAQLDLFYKECELLKALSHPNIVELFDIGVFEEEGGKKPYFVMPLLRGFTLQELIRTSSHRLTTARSVDIISQACRGLQAAHEAGLVHRDMKPSNIFVMEDDSVKIIDFGVARVVEVLSETGWKGTLAYMSPEQIELKPVSSASDIFSLGVVAYETLTRRRPFEGQSERDVADAIMHFIPPPVSTLSSELNPMVGHVIHKAIAKKPYHRFPSAREFADALQKAMRNEMIDIFDPARIQPRIERATRAFDQGDYQFASEILGELESEGHIDQAISTLRGRVEQVVRQKKVQRLIDGARSRFEEGEYPLALQKIQEALEIDPDNAEALGLRQTVESKRTVEKIEDWFRLARQHIDNYSFDHARQAVENVLEVDPGDTQARRLLVDIQRKEQDYLKVRQEKDSLYRLAQESWQRGDVTGALSKLERVLQLERRAPDRSAPGRENSYLTLYNQVRSEHDLINNAYAEGRRHIAERSFAKAKAVCDQFLTKYPGNALFQALRFDIEEQERQEGSAYIVETDRRVEAEPNLERRVAILEEALKRYPGEAHFERALRLMREKRDFVQSIVAKANYHEAQLQFVEAIGQWEILKTVYREYPGVEFEIERLTKRRDQQLRVQAKTRWVEQIDQNLEAGDYSRALEVAQSAQAEFAGDAELAQMEKLAREGIERGEEAQRLLAEAQEECNQKRFDKGIEILRRAYKLDERNPALRKLLADTLVEQARTVIDHDGRTAEDLIQQALELDPNHVQARGFRTLILDRRKHEFVDQCRAQARQLQAAGDTRGAMHAVDQAFARFPNEPQLTQLRANLSRILSEERSRDLDRLRHMVEDAEASSDAPTLTALSERASDIARNYPDDPDVSALITKIRRRTRSLVPAKDKAALPVDGLEETQVLPRRRFQLLTLASSFFRQMTTQIRELAGRLVSTAASWRASAQRESAEASEDATVRREMPLRIRAERMMRKITARPIYWIPALVVFLGLLIALPLGLKSKKSSPHKLQPPPTPAWVFIQHVPPGAVVKIDGIISKENPVQLDPGSYKIEVSLDGFIPFADTMPIQSETKTWVFPGLQPQGATLLLSEAQPDTVLDDVPLQERERQDLIPGPHVLKLAKPAEAQIKFDTEPRTMPQITDLNGVPRYLFAAAVSTYDSSARILLRQTPRTFKLLRVSDPPIELPGSVRNDAGVLVAENLPRGRYILRLGEGENVRDVDVEIGAIPTISIQISELTAGTVYISTLNENKDPLPNVHINLDGNPYKEATNREGKLRISLEGGKKYKFSVVPPAGFGAPGEQEVNLLKGRTLPLTFIIPAPKPTPPQLAGLSFPVVAEQEGAEVLVDDKRIESIKGGEEKFEFSGIQPGKHTIALKKDKYKHELVTRDFAAGEVVRLTAKEVLLRPTFGYLKLDITPKLGTSTLNVRRNDEKDFHALLNVLADLPAGEYEYTATADDYDFKQGKFTIRASETEPLAVHLNQKSHEYGMDYFEEPKKWQSREGGWWWRKGGNYIKFISPVATGTYTFLWSKKSGRLNILSAKGKMLKWTVDFVDEKNCLYFEFDGGKLVRSEKDAGVEKPRVENSASTPKGIKSDFLIRVKVTPEAVETEITDTKGNRLGGDSCNIPGHKYGIGKFAFYLPNDDEVWIKNFNFQSKR